MRRARPSLASTSQPARSGVALGRAASPTPPGLTLRQLPPRRPLSNHVGSINPATNEERDNPKERATKMAWRTRGEAKGTVTR
jgi:hypothetical protein